MASFKGSKADKLNKESNALAQLEIDGESDAFLQAKKNIEISKGLRAGELDPTVYRGEKGYQNYFEQTEEDLRLKKFSGTLGPVKGPTFIRNTTRVDYNPERCKDFYETGRCNFGDSCIFIHDRSDYKSGWQLDQEFEAEQKRKHLKMMGHDVDDGDENYEINSDNNNE
jgi:RING finger protein 113A